MAPSVQIVLSSCLTFGVPMLFAARELIVLRRGGGGHWRPRGPDPAPPPRPNTNLDGVRPYDRPLPDCLIPKPMPNLARPRERVLKPV